MVLTSKPRTAKAFSKILINDLQRKREGRMVSSAFRRPRSALYCPCPCPSTAPSLPLPCPFLCPFTTPSTALPLTFRRLSSQSSCLPPPCTELPLTFHWPFTAVILTLIWAFKGVFIAALFFSILQVTTARNRRAGVLCLLKQCLSSLRHCLSSRLSSAASCRSIKISRRHSRRTCPGRATNHRAVVHCDVD